MQCNRNLLSNSFFLVGERWLSGLKRRIANPLYEFLYRGFESLSFRVTDRNVSNNTNNRGHHYSNKVGYGLILYS